jgi:hypothetical protein
MTARTTRIVLLAAVFALTASVAGFAQLPCGVTNQIVCQPWDGSGNVFASQNDNVNGNGNFATVYQQFTLGPSPLGEWDVESFHWVGGYFNPATQGPITAWTLTFYNDAAGIPGGAIASGLFTGTGGETCITSDCTVSPYFVYWLYFKSFDMRPGTYWASVVPNLGFPPQ